MAIIAPSIAGVNLTGKIGAVIYADSPLQQRTQLNARRTRKNDPGRPDQRAATAYAAQLWRTMPDATRDAWRATEIQGQKGFQAFVSCIATQLLTGLTLTTDIPAPTRFGAWELTVTTATPTRSFLFVDIVHTQPLNGLVVVKGSRAQPPGRSSWRTVPHRLLQNPGGPFPDNYATAYRAAWGDLSLDMIGYELAIRAYLVEPGGQRSPFAGAVLTIE